MTSEVDREPSDSWVGATLGPYLVLNRIGAGGMATVYLARDTKHQRQVAIKVLRPELAASLGKDRFMREIGIAARLSHPHILPVFDSGEARGSLYYVMPFIEGESLRDRLQRDGKIAVAEAIRIADQIASALDHAHERGVTHRDIKPENILMTGDQAIVADFGIARAVEAAGGERLTSTGLAVGTPAYMSPEQAFGYTVDSRTDVYALGCVVYEMVGGRPPFEGGTPQALLARHAGEPVASLRSSDPEIPLFLERAVERALAKDPADRFDSPGAFAAAITTGTVVPSVRRPAWRKQGAMMALGAALVTAIIGVTTLFDGSGIRSLAVLPLTDLTADTSQAWLVEGVHEALMSELSQLGVSVIARRTIRQYADTDRSIREIARELNVDAVIEGSFFRAGDSLEIAARMYDAESEREVWSGSYDGDLPNVVALYRGIARAVADSIHLKLEPRDDVRLSRAGSVNPVVYEAYLRGMYLLSRSRPVDDLSEVLGYFNRAIEANPVDPLAYTGLATAYVTIGHGPAPSPDAWPRARAAAERALRLDSTLAEAWSAMAQVRMYYERDVPEAELAFQRANLLNPSLAMNHYHYAWLLTGMPGRGDQALAEHHRARELDPLTPLFTVWIPGIYVYQREYDKALDEARKVIEQYPDHPVALYVLGWSASLTGNHDEAVAVHERMAALDDRWTHALARTYASAGRLDDARRILAQLEAEPPTSWRALGLAEVHAALGNRDEAFRWMRYEPRHAFWGGLHTPALDPIRDDPRFRELEREVRLPST